MTRAITARAKQLVNDCEALPNAAVFVDKALSGARLHGIDLLTSDGEVIVTFAKGTALSPHQSDVLAKFIAIKLGLR